LEYIFYDVNYIKLKNLQKSFGQMAVETMACGTAVVSIITSGFIYIIEQ
jgi:hypothetical protein